MRYFSRCYRCITYNARGYPPSDVPDDPGVYGQESAVADAIAVLDHYAIDKSHIVGLSMGGFATLHIGMKHADRATALVVAGCGYGAPKGKCESFQKEVDVLANHFEREGTEKAADVYAGGAHRCSTRTKTHAAGPSSAPSSSNIRRAARHRRARARRRAAGDALEIPRVAAALEVAVIAKRSHGELDHRQGADLDGAGLVEALEHGGRFAALELAADQRTAGGRPPRAVEYVLMGGRHAVQRTGLGAARAPRRPPGRGPWRVRRRAR